MTTITNLAQAITTQKEFNVIAKELWAMNLERFLKLGFSLDFSTSKATQITITQLEQLKKSA